MTVVSDALSVTNVTLALLIFVFQLAQVVECRRQGLLCWHNILHAFMALYWMWVYIFILLVRPVGYDYEYFALVFIRPGFTFTLALMAASSIIRGKRR